MKLISACLASALCLTAFGFTVKELPDIGGGGQSPKLARRQDDDPTGQPCKDNDDCIGACDAYGGCWVGQEDICWGPNPRWPANTCGCQAQDATKACACMDKDDDVITVDSCKRGPLGSGTIYCVWDTDCQSGNNTGGTPTGNGNCDATENPCLSP